MAKFKHVIKQHHKLFALLITLMVCAALFIIGATFAWLKDADHKTNNMHLADLEGKINNTSSTEIAQDEPLQQNVSVTNNGKSPVFVRVLVLPVCMVDGVSQEIEIGKQLNVSIDTSCWAYCEDDGYYYYKDKIMPGKTSRDIFTSVELLSSEVGYEIDEWSFEFKAEFVGTTSFAYRIAWWNEKVGGDELTSLSSEDSMYDVDAELSSRVQQ